MRGQQTIYTGIFPQSVVIEPTRKGNRNVNIEQRDKALASRYFYHVHVLRKRYDDALADLEREFFITPASIVQRLQEMQEYLKELVSMKVSVTDLKKLYPFYTW